MLCMFFFNVKETPAAFYTLAGITQFFFSGFNTAIYAIIPDCVEYGEWKTGLRNDGFQYAFVSLGNKIGMAIGTALLAALLGKYGYVANQAQNPAVLSIMRNSGSPLDCDSNRSVLLSIEQKALQRNRRRSEKGKKSSEIDDFICQYQNMQMQPKMY